MNEKREIIVLFVLVMIMGFLSACSIHNPTLGYDKKVRFPSTDSKWKSEMTVRLRLSVDIVY